MWCRRWTGGFTLVELLIVCAIIGILASMAAVNYSEATTRSKVSRVKADMFAMATAVESYATDNNKDPVRHHRWEQRGLEETSDALTMAHEAPFTEKVFDPDEGETTASVGLHVLTTPIAYLTCLPPDIFNIHAQPLESREVPVYWSYG